MDNVSAIFPKRMILRFAKKKKRKIEKKYYEICPKKMLKLVWISCIIVPSLTAKKRRELINKGFLRFLNCPKRSYILLLFLGFPYYSFHADIRQDLIIRSKTCHLMKPVGKVCPSIGRQISLLFTRPVHVH